MDPSNSQESLILTQIFTQGFPFRSIQGPFLSRRAEAEKQEKKFIRAKINLVNNNMGINWTPVKNTTA